MVGGRPIWSRQRLTLARRPPAAPASGMIVISADLSPAGLERRQSHARWRHRLLLPAGRHVVCQRFVTRRRLRCHRSERASAFAPGPVMSTKVPDTPLTVIGRVDFWQIGVRDLRQPDLASPAVDVRRAVRPTSRPSGRSLTSNPLRAGPEGGVAGRCSHQFRRPGRRSARGASRPAGPMSPAAVHSPGTAGFRRTPRTPAGGRRPPEPGPVTLTNHTFSPTGRMAASSRARRRLDAGHAVMADFVVLAAGERDQGEQRGSETAKTEAEVEPCSTRGIRIGNMPPRPL